MKRFYFVFLSLAALFLCSCHKKNQPLVLMSFNIRLDMPIDESHAWNDRRFDISEYILVTQPDIIGLQEVMPIQLEDLNTDLNNYDYISVGREPGRTGESCPIFYNKKRFSVLKWQCFSLSEMPDSIGIKGWDAAYNRVAIMALFYDDVNNDSLWVLNTHLDNYGDLARIKSAELICDKLSEVGSKAPIFVMGDFNTQPNTEVLQIFEERLALKDSRDLAEKTIGPRGSFHGFGTIEENYRPTIDFILTTDRFKVLVFKTFEDHPANGYMSDHYPIITTIENLH